MKEENPKKRISEWLLEEDWKPKHFDFGFIGGFVTILMTVGIGATVLECISQNIQPSFHNEIKLQEAPT